MGCRCSDMRKCTRDISRVTKIQEILSSIRSLNEDVSDALNNLRSCSAKAFSTINMNELQSEEIKLNEDIKEIVPDLISKCIKKEEELRRRYRSMKSEDRSYHERKRKRNSSSN